MIPLLTGIYTHTRKNYGDVLLLCVEYEQKLKKKLKMEGRVRENE